VSNVQRALALAILLVVGTNIQAPAGEPAPLLGFSPTTSGAERTREATFDAALSAANQRAWMQRMSARPHHVGSPLDKANAEFIASLYRSWGYETKIERFTALFPTPKLRMLELIAPTHVRAKLFEPPIPGDRTSAQADRLPSYNAYSIDGNVTAPLVYVNYGVPADYDILARHGIDVRGKIVIARFGHSWRGVKPLVAAEHGAVGCLIYTDPADDGYAVGDAYPKGTARSADAVQRGSVMDWQTRPGDPSADRSVLTKIPTLPISSNDARPLLAALGGAVVPADWRGAVPLTYHYGDGKARVHLQVAFNWTTAPLYDVIATLRGSELPDEWVVRGNHHDGWVHGAEDPLSGQVAMLEEARAIAMLAKDGSRPRRTAIFASWDGEEPGLLGSTAWSTAHADDLQRHAVIYINTDTDDRGILTGDGSSVLTALFNSVARDVVDPERHVSAYERARDAQLVSGDRALADLDTDLALDPLGSGSDFNPFSAHLGIETIDFAYGGEPVGGLYHSNYDSFDAFTRLDDPGFAYGMLMAKTGGRMILRTANADVLPYRFMPFATAVAGYVKNLDNEIATLRKHNQMQAALAKLNAYTIASDPLAPEVTGRVDDAVPAIDTSALGDAIARLQASARACDARLATAPATQAPTIDALLRSSERALLDPAGLPRRPWMRHQIMGPGRYTGYTAKTLPYAREAIEAGAWDEARTGLTTIAAALNRYSDIIDQTTKALSP
jgi:N-acetylated-alpha-linked acidic dipeptidase